MSKFGDAINLEKYLSDREKLRNRIHKVGLELEGGWDEIPKGSRIIRDSSVELLPQRHVGENVSHPIEIGSNYDPVDRWLEKNYPDGVNHTCGMHVHVSFKHIINYVRVMRADFPATVVNGFKKWAEREKLRTDHSLWDRLNGKSIYCQHKYEGDEQLLNTGKDYDKIRKGHRYTVINYAYNRTGTMECRLLPMMDTVDQAISAVHEVLDITNAFLLATATREKKLKAEVSNDSKTSRETYDIYISG